MERNINLVKNKDNYLLFSITAQTTRHNKVIIKIVFISSKYYDFIHLQSPWLG
jgi:hypothetical protein